MLPAKMLANLFINLEKGTSLYLTLMDKQWDVCYGYFGEN